MTRLLTRSRYTSSTRYMTRVLKNDDIRHPTRLKTRNRNRGTDAK